MRIISGKHKGRQLVSFDADHIRPTTDRVKETLFNKLMNHIAGARVLDLFSGTGNLAIECLSRDAAWVDIVENHKQSLAIIRENLGKLKINQGFKIHPIDAFTYIDSHKGEPYNLVLADPPFTRAWADELAQKIGTSRLLDSDSIVVIEARAKETVAESYPGLKRLDQRTFGDKYLYFFTSTGTREVL